MECNKDEAVRSKAIAERKLSARDFVGARKFAALAQRLDPDLDGLPHLLALLEVQIAAQKKLKGGEQADWFAILQVDNEADEGTIRKQFRKLALLLHPDKNKYTGADAAFKLVSEAWRAISLHRRIPPVTIWVDPPSPVDEHLQPEHVEKLDTFLTQCPACMTLHEHLRECINQNLFCVNCEGFFVAQECVPMGNGGMNVCVENTQVKETGTGMTEEDKQDEHEYEHDTVDKSETYFFPDKGEPRRPAHELGEGSEERNNVEEELQREVTRSHEQQEDELITRQETEGAHSRERTGKQKQHQVKERQREAHDQATPQLKDDKKQKSKDDKKHKSKDDQKQKLKNLRREAWERLLAEEASDDGSKAKSKTTSEKTGSMKKSRDKLKGGNTKAVKHGKGKSGHRIPTAESTQQETCGVALRKSPRKRRNVRCYSPGDGERPPPKKPKADEAKAAKVKREVSVEGRGKETSSRNSLQRGKEPGKNEENLSVEGKGKDSNSLEREKEVGKDESLLGNVFPDDLKFRMKEEIKKQILEGLGQAGKAALQDLQVVDIEEIRPSTMASSSNIAEGADGKDLQNASFQQYIGKVKLTATLIIPLTIPVGQEPDKFEDTSCGLPPEDPEDPEDSDLINVPNSEFYDFDRDRREEQFAEGQIWAVYDDTDGMPRYYVRISKILSMNPFKVEITWLDPKCSSTEAQSWVDSGNSLTCGEYEAGEPREPITITHVDSFSHMMKWQEGPRGEIRIYPAEGDVWALYKGWNAFTRPEGLKQEYEIVQVVTDNIEDSTVGVVPLVNFKGFKTLYIRQAKTQETIQISKQEMARFSHQIPTYSLVGDEVPGVSKGCIELDPASTPVHLIFDN